MKSKSSLFLLGEEAQQIRFQIPKTETVHPVPCGERMVMNKTIGRMSATATVPETFSSGSTSSEK